jgi:hypothetical protein
MKPANNFYLLALLGLLLATPAVAQVNPGTSPLSIPKGGTGASTAAGAAANLGVPFINVKSSPFSAKGDGTSDDTTSINNAIAAAITAGGGTVYFPASTACYKTTNQLTVDLSAITTRFQGKIQLLGDGQGRSCIINTTFTGIFIKYTGNASALESDFMVKGLRIVGNASAINAGSIGLQINKAAFFHIDDVDIEALDLAFDATDVEQSEFLRSQFRFNNGGLRFNGASTITSTNSIAFYSTTVSNNATFGLQVTNPNSLSWYGGSIQYNGSTACGGTTTNCYGIRLVDPGDGYGTVLFSGMSFEGNGGQGDIWITNTAHKANVLFDNVAWLRTANFSGLGFGTNQLFIDGSNADSNYKIVNSNFYGLSGYSASAGRPAINNTNASATLEIDGLTKFWSNTEAPSLSSIYTGYAGSRDGSVKFGQAAGGLSTLSAPASASSFAWSLPAASGTLLYSGGPLGTPSSGTVTNLTGTASININGTVGATTPTTGGFTALFGSTSILCGASSTSITGVPFVCHVAADKNLYVGSNFNLADGVSFGSINDANNTLKSMELRGSTVQLTGTTVNLAGTIQLNGTGFGSGVEAALKVNTGTAGSHVVNGGALGTPSSGTGTNITGVPISTGISGLGTGVATALAAAPNASAGFSTSPYQAVSVTTVSAVATVDIPIPSGARFVEIRLNSFDPVTANQDLQMIVSTNSGVSYDTTAANYSYGGGFTSFGGTQGGIAGGAAALPVICRAQVVGFFMSAIINLTPQSNAGDFQAWNWQSTYKDNTAGGYISFGASGAYFSATTITNVRLRYASGNIANGTYSVTAYR